MPSNGDAKDHELGMRMWACREQLTPYAMRLTKNQDDAEELVATAIERGWRYRRQFDPTTNIQAWLSFIMRNCFITQMRRRKWDGGHLEDYENLVIPIKQNQDDWMTLRNLEESLCLIPPLMAEAIMAIVFEGTYEEAAVALGVRIGTVKSRVGRGRKMLEDLGL